MVYVVSQCYMLVGVRKYFFCRSYTVIARVRAHYVSRTLTEIRARPVLLMTTQLMDERSEEHKLQSELIP